MECFSSSVSKKTALLADIARAAVGVVGVASVYAEEVGAGVGVGAVFVVSIDGEVVGAGGEFGFDPFVAACEAGVGVGGGE